MKYSYIIYMEHENYLKQQILNIQKNLEEIQERYMKDDFLENLIRKQEMDVIYNNFEGLS